MLYSMKVPSPFEPIVVLRLTVGGGSCCFPFSYVFLGGWFVLQGTGVGEEGSEVAWRVI